jgi:hypothetical protein
MYNSNDMQRAIASNKSYVSSAVITFIAYMIFWIPGLIFNVMYINDARKSQQVAGHSLPGVGCLYVLLIVNIAWVVGLCLVTGGLGILGTAR